jgi:hypothetical protein
VLYPGGITEISRGLSEATPPGRDARKDRSSSRRDGRRGGRERGWMTIQTRTFRRRRRKFCAGLFGDRIRFVWHPSGMLALRVSRSGGVVAGAPQPPANFCDPSRGQDEASMLYPGGIRLNPDRLASLRDANFERFGIRGCRRCAPQPPANYCEPSGFKKFFAESVKGFTLGLELDGRSPRQKFPTKPSCFIPEG